MFSMYLGGRSLFCILIYSCNILQTSAATFDAESFFSYVDVSCRNSPGGTIKHDVNFAGKEMTMLLMSTIGQGFKFDANDSEGGRVGRAFDAWWGRHSSARSRDDPINTQGIKEHYKAIRNMPAKRYGIYCDSSAFEIVNTWPADTPKHLNVKPGSPTNEPKVYIKDPLRRAPNEDWIAPAPDKPDGTPLKAGEDMCGAGVAAHSGKSSLWLCPIVFSRPIGKLLTTFRAGVEVTSNLNKYNTMGSIMLHEFSHLVSGTTTDEAYGAQDTLELVKNGKIKEARNNADSYSMYALAIYLEGNEWSNDGYAEPLKAAVRPTISRIKRVVAR